MSDKGYVSLHRKIQDNPIWLEEVPFDRRAAWIDLIMSANIKQKSILYKGKNIQIKRGQVYTSIRKLASRWHWGKDRTLRFLRLLEEMGMIKRQTIDCATVVTIVNYGFYQDVRDTNKDTNKDRHRDKGKDTDKPLLNNVNNVNNENNNKPSARDGVDRPPTDEDDEITKAILNEGW